jgi:SMC interacting uncharacterized protein involved in chromosome segregation
MANRKPKTKPVSRDGRAKSSGNDRLEEALQNLLESQTALAQVAQAQATMVQTQATFVQEQADLRREQANLRREQTELRREQAELDRENKERFARIEKTLDILVNAITRLPDVLREQIEFKPPAR